jgi:hypothetical protein
MNEAQSEVILSALSRAIGALRQDREAVQANPALTEDDRTIVRNALSEELRLLRARFMHHMWCLDDHR